MKHLLLLLMFLMTVSCGAQTEESTAFTPPDFIKKGNANIEIISPKPNQIISPGSTIEVETLIQMKDGESNRVYISGEGIPFRRNQAPPEMHLVSKEGDTYRHRYTIENAEANSVYSVVMVQVVEKNGGISVGEVGYLVKEIPKIIITSLKDGQTFTKVNRIPILINVENRGLTDNYKIFLNGKYYARIPGDTFYWLSPKAGTFTIQIVAMFAEVELTRSELLTVHVIK